MSSPRDVRPLPAAGDLPRVRELPKVSLHDHLEGGLRESTILEAGESLGLALPADDVESLGAWFLRAANSGSLVTVLESFWMSVAVMQTADVLSRVACEYVLDLASDGVIYGEVRWAPENMLTKGLSLDDAVEAVQSGLETGIATAAAQGHRIVVRQLLTAMRNGANSLEIARLALRWRDRGVAGFDIAGPEAGFPPSLHRDAFELLASEFFPATVHAGEAAGLDSIRSALVDGRASRLGHGVRITEDIDATGTGPRLGQVARWVRDHGVVLETSPTSNLQTGAVPSGNLAEHPFDLLHRLGFAVTVNTDNRLISQTTLSHEIALLCDTFGYGLPDLERFQLNALSAAFVDAGERAQLEAVIRTGHAPWS
ncbi:adenosine deaminase [Kribbella solani]|uniref:adenosine deaminase n=1 Tax=Kribbella solani TaxID=236067 RepID=A0A841DPM0_9ACTN|nr:adenosine deaminase [Kribbella solani]MBB5977398.1 adenosine deaminase [Kribbella solani]